MGGRGFPESTIPYPHCGPSTCASATDLMSQDSGFYLVSQRPRPLWGLTASPDHQGSPNPVTFATIASATTVATSVHCLDDTCSARGGSAPADDHEVAFAQEDYSMAFQPAPFLRDSRPPGFQLLPRPFSGRRSADLPSLGSATSLPSSPATPNTPFFASNPVITEYTRPFLVVETHQDITLENTSNDLSLFQEPPDLDKPQHLDRLHKKQPEMPPVSPLVAFRPEVDLTAEQLQRAWNMQVFDQNGRKVRFGDLSQLQRTCVIFIRHFWSTPCMDYMQSIKEQADPERLSRAGVKLLVISNGSPAMIPSYRRIHKFPFLLYTDPSCKLYHALGMTLRTTDSGLNSERGDYVRHGVAGGIAMIMKNAIWARMPFHKNGGDPKQLGGEFVLGPGLRCSYVSRMHNTRSHAPVRDVLIAAGVPLDHHQMVQTRTIYDDEEQWMRNRDVELRRIQSRKGKRRGYIGEYPRSESSDSHDGSLEA